VIVTESNLTQLLREQRPVRIHELARQINGSVTGPGRCWHIHI
jgi:hypothetical protein